MSSRPLAQRRQRDREDVQAVVEVAAERARRDHRPRGRGWSRRRCARRPACVRVPPRRSNSCSWRTRSSFGCSSSGMSPISSRKSVPPSASSKRPMRCAMAPVNAPRSWPKSSLSSRPVGMAAQLILTNVRSRRALQVVDGARDQLLAGAGLAADEHGRVGRARRSPPGASTRFSAGESPDDLLEVVLGPDLVLEVDLLRRELVLERGDLLERERVLDRERDLVRDRREQLARPRR